VIAASYVPASASNPSLHEHTDEQPVTQIAAQTAGVRSHPPVLESLSADDLRDQSPLHPLDGRSFANRSSGNLSTISIESLASDRFSIITNSRVSLRAARGQPSRLPRAGRRSSVNSTGNLSNISSRSRASDRYSILTNPRESISSPLGPPSPSRRPRATHRQFGSGPDSSRSRERPSHPHTPTSPPLEIITTNLTSLHGDGKVKPVVQSPASSSSVHQPLSPPSVDSIRRRQSMTSVVVNVQSPSSDSLSVSPSSYSPKYSPQITEEPLAIDSDDYLSPGSPAVDLHDESYPGLPTSSNPATLDYFIPDGRFVQLINSEQIPRYDKNATMRVGYTILSLHPNTSLQIPRRDSLRFKTFNNRIPLVRCNLNDSNQFNRALSSFPEPDGSEQDLFQNDCTPWIPATHPDGALYFYDEGRVRVSVIVGNPQSCLMHHLRDYLLTLTCTTKR
jgi:hypothetical protein